MERITSRLKEREMKQSNLVLQWKGLLDHFDSTRNALNTEFEELHNQFDSERKSLQNRNRELEDREKELEAKVLNFNSEMESKAEELHAIERLVEEKINEVGVKKKRLLQVEKLVREKEMDFDLVQTCIEDRKKELEAKVLKFNSEMESKAKELHGIERLIEEKRNEHGVKEKRLLQVDKLVREKEREFDLVLKNIAESTEKLDWVGKSLEESSKELESKKKEVTGVQGVLNTYRQDIELNRKQLNAIKGSIEEGKKVYALNQQEVVEEHKSLEECQREIKLRKEELSLIQKSMVECSHTLESIEKTKSLKTEQFEFSPANIFSFPPSGTNQSSINRDGRSLQLLMNEHLKRNDLLGSEILAVLQASSDPAKLILDAMQGFYPLNSTVDGMESDFDLRVIRRSCILLLQELKRLSPQINPQVREEAMRLAVDWKAKMAVATDNWLEVLGFLQLVSTYKFTAAYDAKDLQSLLAIVSQQEQATELGQAFGITNEAPVKLEVPESSLVRNAATSSSPNLHLSSSTDARNFQGFPHRHLSGNNSMQTETSFAKNILKLMQTSFDKCWGKGDDSLDAAVMDDKISLLKDLADVSSHVGPDVRKDAIELAVRWKAKMRTNSDNFLEILGFMQFIATYGLLSTLNGDEIVKLLGMICQHKQALELCQTFGFADKIPEFVQNLIERKQLTEAVRLICTFKLIEKFPPAPILKEYVEDARKSYLTKWMEKKSLDKKDDEVVDNQIGDLRAVIQCIKDNSLESEFPSKDIEIEISMLEKLKESRRCSVPSVACEVEQKLEKGKKRVFKIPLRPVPSVACEVEQRQEKGKKRIFKIPLRPE